MEFTHLLAKSSKDPENPRREETLVGHTEAVIESATVFGDVLTEQIVSVLGDEFDSAIWQEALFCSTWLHDVGKANNHFQKMIRNHEFYQGIRHETLGIVVAAEFLAPWLQQVWSQRKYPEWFWPAVLYAVSGHHLKFPDSKDRGGIEVHFLGKHQEIKDILEIGRIHFGLDYIPELPNHTYSLLTFGGIGEMLTRLRRAFDLDLSPKTKLFIAVLKSILMCSDVAGSALPEKIEDTERTIRRWLKKRITPLLQKEQLEDVVNKKLKGATPRFFQRQVRDSSCNTVLVEAGCGSGKTVAAYLWAAREANGKRLFFCYPTTGTASEGFAGYLQDPDFEAILVNSRADVDYRLLESLPPKTRSQIELRNLRLEALETWPVPAVVCTAHTALGILQNARRGIFALPSLLRSAFVFDEIHSYSPRLFQHLIRFLDIFSNASVLMMTATLPPVRKNALEEACKKRGGIHTVKGPAERENAKRYVLQRSDKETAWDKVNKVLDNGGKVLWVCNTVHRSMGIVEKACDEGLPVQPFHSRYRYKDRLCRQRAVVDGFLQGKPAMLAVTTQVAEMSLDLSADLLVTDYAPIASLIQRLGRLNRFEDIPQMSKTALVIKPPNAMPYATRDEEAVLWEQVESWLDLVSSGEPVSQRELADAFVSVLQDEVPFDMSLHCDWIDDPWVSLANCKSLMEPGYTIEVVRQEDLEGGRLDEMIIPMPLPKGNIWQTWMRKGRYLIAPTETIEYEPFTGGRYAQKQSESWII